ncbi:MAG: hypothetical protein IKF91_03880 [Bacilli bacterium]|nr:hypothetical protein [Bacilli bacterium]
MSKIYIFLLSIVFFVSVCFAASASPSYDLEATLYDSSLYGSGTGTVLTETGSSVSNWLYDTSKFLQINPNVPADGNTYTVTINLPQEFYAVTSGPVAPVGYSGVTFTKNESIHANNNTTTYNLNNYSGSFVYTLESGVTSGTIQMEVRYDRLLWDKLASSKLTSNSVNPIEVILKNETTGDVLKRLYVKEATSSSAFGISSIYNHTSVNGTSYTDSSINLLVADTATYYPTIITTSQTTEYSFYKKLQYDITLPSYTDSSSVKHYLDYTITGDGNYTPTIDTSNIASGKILLTYNDIYFSTSSVLYKATIKFPDELKSSSQTSFSFSSGSQRLNVSDKNGNMKLLKSGNTPTFNYKTQADENVTLTGASNTTTVKDRPDNVVTLLGGFRLRNAGSADSEGKNFKITFDSANTNLIKVTTYRIPLDVSTNTVNIKYTLVDEDGNKVCLDSSGNRVEESSSATCEWTYALNNTYYGKKKANNQSLYFHRNLLPTNLRSYYFKTLEYSLTALPSATYLYGSSGASGFTSGGNFLGYVDLAGVNGNKVTSTMVMTSQNFATKNVTSTTNLSDSSTTAYGIDSMKVNKTSVSAGNSVVATGRISVSNYPYGNSTWLRDIVLGVVLPSGVTINEQSVFGYTTNANNKVYPTSITNTQTSDGKVLWRLFFPNDIYVGYANETGGAISAGSYFNFSFQMDTAYYLNQQTINLVDSMFSSSSSQSNSASGGWNWAPITDKYDVNNNGSVTDRIARVRTNQTASFEITPQTATFEISDSVSVTSSGEIGETGNIADLYSNNDVVNYKLQLDCLSGGSAEDFQYFIPIPKKTSGTDSYLINGSKPFDLSLVDSGSITGSDVYDIEYSFETGINYDEALSDEAVWYSSDEIDNTSSLKYEDVTMIRLRPKLSVIPNGSSTALNLKLKYSSNSFDEDAGMMYVFHSAGYYKYLNNGRELSGNFNTDGVTVRVNYENSLPDITLTASGGELSSGNVRERTIGSDLPIFKNAQNYTITNIEAYNVVLKTKSYMESNTNMNSSDGNKTFGLTVSLNNGLETDIVGDSVSLGANNNESLFKFKLYNSNILTDNYTSRYVLLTISGDNGVTLRQKIIINRELSQASDPTSSIMAGSQYNLFDDVNSSVLISQNSSLTAQFVTSYIPDLYGEHVINLSKSLPSGTTITLVNSTDLSNIGYWYYIIDGDETNISFSNFIKMGSVSDKSYTYYTGGNVVNEKLLLIVDFSNVSSSDLVSDNYAISLNIKGNSVDDLNSSLNFTTADKRAFSLTGSNSFNVKSDYEMSYSVVSSTGDESIYNGRKLSLVVYGDNLPLDSSLSLNGVKYYLNLDGKFILPLGYVLGSGESFVLNFNSDLFSLDSYSLKMELWASATGNSSSPLMGEKVASKTVSFNNPKVVNPSLIINGMESQLLESDDLNKNLSLSFDALDISGCTSTIELQQKIGNGYQKLTNRLASVNGSTSHDTGAYIINTISGSNNINLILSSQTESGTYRFVIKVKKNDQTLLEVPYNFIVLNN